VIGHCAEFPYFLEHKIGEQCIDHLEDGEQHQTNHNLVGTHYIVAVDLDPAGLKASYALLLAEVDYQASHRAHEYDSWNGLH